MRDLVDRSSLQWRLLLYICLCAFVGCGIATAEQGASAGGEPEIWLGMRGLARDWHGVNGYQGWERLFFQANETWPESMEEVRVIAIGSPVISNLSDSDLAKVVARLKQKQISLTVNILAQAYLEAVPTCGQNVEGYSARGDHRAVAARVKRAGGTIRYVAMDEPLYFGHYYGGPHACHSTIENIAERVAANIREYQNFFPDVAVVDTVPIPSLTEQPHWQQDYRKWTQAFRTAVGQPIAMTSIDIDWNRAGWQSTLSAMTTLLRAERLPFGIIYNSVARKATTNEEWLRAAQDHFAEIEGKMHIVPDKAVFDSWDRLPIRAFSDDTGLGEDYLVKEYVAMHHR